MAAFSSLGLAMLGAAAACTGGPPKTPGPTPSASASSSAYGIDPSRADAALLRALAPIRDPGDILGALDATSRDALTKVEAMLEPADRAKAARGDKAIVAAHPLLAIALGSDDPDALYAVAARGMASRELLYLRSIVAGNKPIQELPNVAELGPTTRELSRRAAARLARLLFEQGRASVRPMATAEADRAEAIGRILGDTTLQRVAAEHAVKMDGTPRYHAYAAYTAARGLDVQSAHAHLQAVGTPTDEPTRVTFERSKAAVERADLVVAARTSKATGSQALDAATAAVRIERADVAAELLAQSGIAPDADLRAAVVHALVTMKGSLCDGLEISGEHVVLCAALWEANPNVPKITDVLRRGLGSTRGRDAWSVESYTGIVQVLPMIYSLARGGVKGEGDARMFFRRLFQEPRDVIVPSDAIPQIRRDAFALFSDAVGAAYKELEKNGTGNLKIPAEARADFRARAEKLVSVSSSDPWVTRAIIASMVVIASQEDTSPILSRVVATGDLGTSLGMVLATTSVRYRRPEVMQRARDLLLARNPGEAPALRWRADVVADEARMALLGDGRASEALLQTINVDIPSDGGVPERLQYATDLMGLASRAGQQQDAELIADQVTAGLAQAPESSDTRELREALLSAVDVIGARSVSADRRKAAAKRMDERIAKRANSPASEALLYSAVVLRALVVRDERGACKPKDSTCLTAVDDRVKKIDEAMVELTATMNPSTAELAKNGTLPLGGGAQFGLNYSVEIGLSPTLDLTARLLILPPPVLTPIATTPPAASGKHPASPPRPRSP